MAMSTCRLYPRRSVLHSLTPRGSSYLSWVPADLEHGLTPLIGQGLAAKYACTSHNWYLVCAAGG